MASFVSIFRLSDESEIKICIHIPFKDLDAKLREAVRNGDIDRVKILVEKGANVSSKDEDGFAPLHFAADKCNFEILFKENLV